MNDETLQLDDLDRLATEAFPGLVVRKDLLRRMRSAFSVPAFVIEFLLGKYCASTDEDVNRRGTRLRQGDARGEVRQAGRARGSEIVDQAAHHLRDHRQKYPSAWWRRTTSTGGGSQNLNLDYINIDDSLVREHDRLLMGGIWAEIVLRYDDSFIFKGQNRPVLRRKPCVLSSSRRGTSRVSSRRGVDSRQTSGSI